MSPAPRLHIDTALSEGLLLSLGEEASNYLARVLRLGLGGEARLFNGRDGEWLARIESVGARKVAVRLVSRLRAPAQAAAPAMTLLFAPVKKDETDLIVEKAAELGAAALRPVLTERTQTRTVRLDRFHKIAIEAAEQTERLDVPVVLEPLSLMHALADLPAATPLIFCDETGGAPMLDTLATLKGGPVAILIGPEGGFTPFERAGLRARETTRAVSLGPRILRAETAAIAAMTLWQAVCGDWNAASAR